MNATLNLTNMMMRTIKKGALTLGILAASVAAGQAQTDQTAPSTQAWQPYGQMLNLSGTVDGKADIGHYTVSRQNQEMRTDLLLSVYKNAVPVGTPGGASDGFDYYLVTGQFRHSVKGYDHNAWSCGYYGKMMSLTLSAHGAQLIDSGPGSTVGTNTTSWSIGGSLQATAGGKDGGSASAGLSFGYSSSFSTPNVTFGSSTSHDSVTVVTHLPGDKGSPKEPSKDGYQYYVGAIFRVPQGQGLKLSATTMATWDYEYTLLIVNDTRSLMKMGTFNVDFKNRAISSASGSNRCLAATSGNRAVVDTCDFQPDQQWSYTADSQVKNTASGLCLDLQTVGSSQSKLVVTTACDVNKRTQKFRVGTDTNNELMPGIYTLDGDEVTAPGNPVALGQELFTMTPTLSLLPISAGKLGVYTNFGQMFSVVQADKTTY